MAFPESVPGVRGDALKIDARSEMNIARVQSHHRNCFITPSDCTGMLPLGMSLFTPPKMCGVAKHNPKFIVPVTFAFCEVL